MGSEGPIQLRVCASPVDTSAYDELNRLPTASLTGAGAVINFSHTYTYGAAKARPQVVTSASKNVSGNLAFTNDEPEPTHDTNTLP